MINKLIVRIGLFSIPLILWMVLVVLIDPFNYFGLSNYISDKIKQENVRPINNLLYRSFEFKHKPCPNILIGDSRTGQLPVEYIEKLTDNNYAQLSTNAAKLNEIVDMFWLANSITELEEVTIGINFSMYNYYGYQDRVAIVNAMLKNPFLYIFNKNIVEAMLIAIKATFFDYKTSSKPPMNEADFWEWTIKNKSRHWYGKYKYPSERIRNMLIEMDEYAYKNDIQLTFFITPHHEEFREKLKMYQLEEEEQLFKEDLKKLHAKVIDFDYKNDFTMDRQNFRDPIHYSIEAGEILAQEIWLENYKYGKLLK